MRGLPGAPDLEGLQLALSANWLGNIEKHRQARHLSLFHALSPCPDVRFSQIFTEYLLCARYCFHARHWVHAGRLAFSPPNKGKVGPLERKQKHKNHVLAHRYCEPIASF